LVGHDRIVYGSDLPFAPLPLVERSTGGLMATDLLDNTSRHALLRDNALALIPRLDGVVMHR
jgi:hypothetical protein